MSESNKLEVILKQQEVSKADMTKLVEAFGGPFDEAGDIIANYKTIKVSDENDTDTMAEAREKRLILKRARTTVENNRKELKADIVKQGRAIDSVARFVKEEIEPAEAYLESQEKYAEIAKAERLAKRKADRIEKLLAFTDDISLYNLEEMTDAQFKVLLHSVKTHKEAQEAEEVKLKKEEEAKRKAEAEEQERVRKENEKLRAEAEEREKEAEAKREKEEAEEVRLNEIVMKIEAFSDDLNSPEDCDKAAKDFLAYTDSLSEDDLENPLVKAAGKEVIAEIREASTDFKEEAAREAKEAEEREAAKRKAEEAEVEKQKLEAERDALLAPDKIKLQELAKTIRELELPAVKHKDATALLERASSALAKLADEITKEAEKL